MKIVLAGATGFLGTALVRRLADRGEAVTVLTRKAGGGSSRFPSSVKFVQWDGKSQGHWCAALTGVEAVVNLSGESIGGGRWTEARKRRILQSRVEPTRALVEAMRILSAPPAVLVNVSAIGYYGRSGGGLVTEDQGAGTGFLAETCVKWESEAQAAAEFGVRVVLPRIGVVLGSGGGALQRMMIPSLLFVGGPIGTGRQWFPWVHIDDVIGALVHAVDRNTLSGPVNLVAPQPVTMTQFSKALGAALHRPSWFRVPGGILKIGLGEMASLVLEGRQVVPRRLLDSGYSFSYPDLDRALRSLIA